MTWADVVVAGLAFAAAVFGYLTRQTTKEMNHRINSRLDELIAAKGLIARAEGLAEGRAEKKE